MNGYCAAAVAVLIWAAYPVATRAGVTGTFAPQELVTLRFGIGGLLFLPYLLLHFRAIRPKAWLQGLPLMVFQGAGMGALVIYGLQLAPANHQAALGPGVAPAWVALLGFLVFARRPSARLVVGALLCASGVLLLAWWSATERNAAVLAGDAMFLAASALGALYVLQLRTWGVGAIEGAAIVTLYSAMVVVPWHLWSAPEPLWRVGPRERLWQILWQGVLIGCVGFVALNHAIAKLGAERSSGMVALVPVLTASLALIFLGEVPSATEIAAFLAISAGVTVCASRGYGGSPAANSASMKRPACGLSRPG
ncbi:MAG TPA: DMT family transporter [Burkholderiales bacterium]|nr:DMT family transporter [Burkholderiales bacterium]